VFSTSGKVLIIVICMALFEGELVSFVEFGAWFDLPWFQGEYGLLPLRNLEF
jgi:hypothetical protein